MWEVKHEGDSVFVDCRFRPTCPHCSIPVDVLQAKLLNFDLVPYSGKRDAHAIDTECICPKCGYWDVFGVALSKDEYKALRKICGNNVEEFKTPTGLTTRMMMNVDAIGHRMPGWKETNDARGHKPDFAIKCYHCKANGYDENLFFRYSYIAPLDDHTQLTFGNVNQIEYKCSRCGNIAKFLPTMSEEYHKSIMERRKKAGFGALYYMSPDEWKEDKEIERQLEALGYAGGR